MLDLLHSDVTVKIRGGSAQVVDGLPVKCIEEGEMYPVWENRVLKPARGAVTEAIIH